MIIRGTEAPRGPLGRSRGKFRPLPGSSGTRRRIVSIRKLTLRRSRLAPRTGRASRKSHRRRAGSHVRRGEKKHRFKINSPIASRAAYDASETRKTPLRPKSKNATATIPQVDRFRGHLDDRVELHALKQHNEDNRRNVAEKEDDHGDRRDERRFQHRGRIGSHPNHPHDRDEHHRGQEERTSAK